MRAALAGLLLAGLLAAPAAADGGAQVYRSFFLTQRAPDLAATTVSANVPFGLPSGVSAPVAVVCDLGPIAAYVALGGVTADPALSMLILPGQCATLNATGSTNLAAITAAGASDTPIIETMLGSGTP